MKILLLALVNTRVWFQDAQDLKTAKQGHFFRGGGQTQRSVRGT